MKNGRMYGYEITRKVKELTAGELNITEGALYPLLHRLEAMACWEAEMENIGNPQNTIRCSQNGRKEKGEYGIGIKNFAQTLQL